MAGQFISISKKTLRWVSACVLLIPILVFSLRVYLKHENAWNVECVAIQTQLEAIDQISHLPKSPLLLVGSELLWDWRTPPEEINNQPVLVRTSQRLHPTGVSNCFARVIAYYRPNTTLMFLESDDIFNHVDETLEALQVIDERRNYLAVSPHLGVVMPLVNPANFEDREERAYFEQRLAEWAADKTGFYILHLDNALTGGDGKPDPHLFWPDGRTPTETGYLLVDEALREAAEVMVNRQ